MPLHGEAEELATALRKRQDDQATGPATGHGADRAHEPVSAPAQAAFRLMAGLPTRERQIAVEVAEGKDDREIATELFLSVRTVEYHVGNCLAKLGMTSRVELRKALQPATLTLLVPALPGAGPEDGVPVDGTPADPDGPRAP
ncbi:helix-turn-helix transcriptional regulator [Citricoccus parietis]